MNRELSGILLAPFFPSPANCWTLWLLFRFASLKLCLQRQASVLLFFYFVFPLPFFVIFWSSVCSCCRRGAVFFNPFFLVWSAIRFFPTLVFFIARVSFFCLLGVFDISRCRRCCRFMSGSLSVCVCV